MFLSHGILVRITFSLLAIATLYNFYYVFANYLCHSGSHEGFFASVLYPSMSQGHESLVWNEKQCEAAFPLLTKEIDDSVSGGPFQFNRSVDSYTGQVHGRIKDGKLFIISVGDQASRDMLNERNAVLNQLHRAIITSPTALPDTVFTLSILDSPRKHVWSFSRPRLQNSPNTSGEYWIMPHFSFWSWPRPFIGTMDEALTKIERVEKETPWEKKSSKAVWRGTVWFNSIANLNLRPKLMQITKGKEWADVEEMKWENQGMTAKNAIAIEEFCKYKYIIYTEGVTYSGRLPFHQACASIILTPPPNYLLHTTHLMRPLFSSSLPFSGHSKPTKNGYLSGRWPHSYPASKANIVFIDPEWADLEQTISYLNAHQDIAQGIANRQRELIVGAGYLSSAAEVCYWRALIRAWSSVAKVNEEDWRAKDGGIGMRWETFSLLGKLE